MLGLILLSIFIFIVIAIVFIEIRNEKRYQATRLEERQKSSPKKEKVSPPINKEEVKPQPVQKVLPQAIYQKFSHQRLIEMGLSDEEAKEFVQELIPQLEIQIPLIEEALNSSDFHQMERLTHSIKGSTTNIGTGGVSDLLVACNTYLKTGTDSEIANTYFEHLKHYTNELKIQYS